jgi:hypothetical protein
MHRFTFGLVPPETRTHEKGIASPTQSVPSIFDNSPPESKVRS